MIGRFLGAAILALLLAACGQPEHASQRAGTPALWEIEGVGGAPAGWLFGTVHALPDGTKWENSALDGAVRGAGLLVVEVKDLKDQAAIAEVFQDMAYDKPPAPLVWRVPPSARDALDRAVSASGATRPDLARMETWAVALVLARSAAPLDPQNGVDRELEMRFAKRPVVELEGASRQLAVFDRLAEEDQRAMLLSVLKEAGTAGRQSDALVAAWLEGDLAAIERTALQGMLSDPELYDALLAGRNRRWADQLQDFIDRCRRPLVAVGAAHMVGKDGLPALLAAKGYTVRRVQ
ncbi:TraB/GumN family protein [Qipengyuania sp.]|uniref:TraB/GumN family protein n=1 Tax=Qipengyuania sp. TaxID=2004515 RepID=UPI0035C858E7